MSDDDRKVLTLADIPVAVPPDYPKVTKVGKQWYLTVAIPTPEKERDYPMPTDPARFLGLLHHLSAKSWADPWMIHYAIERAARALGWKVH